MTASHPTIPFATDRVLIGGEWRAASETYEVRADGEILTCEPVQSLPLTQRYFLF